MNDEFPNNPFTPGGGHIPPELAGRGEETAMLAKMLKRLKGASVDGKLKIPADDPVRVIGPRGVGKTTLLQWTKKEAEQRDILVVNCAFLQQSGENVNPLQHVLASMERGPSRLVKIMREFGFTLPVVGGGMQVKLDNPDDSYMSIATAVLQKNPLLLLLDEAHRFDPQPLERMLNHNQWLIGAGYPLGVVMAGTPRLASVLIDTKAGFIDRCRKIRINTLSDEATRDALEKPFKRAGLTLAPEALKLMAEQTDNYPAFIQLMGDAVWDVMGGYDRRDADAALIRQIEPMVRKCREEVYEETHSRMRKAGLLPHVRRIIEMIDGNGGEVAEETIFDVLKKTEGVVGDQAEEIYEGLREDGVIWTTHGLAKPGIPSFFNYFKYRDRIQNPPKGEGFQLRNWLPTHVPWPFQRRKRR